MNNSFGSMFKQLSAALKGNTSDDINKMLNSLGVSKEDVLKKLESVDQAEIDKKLNSGEVAKMMENISPEDIEKIKKVNIQDKSEVERLYEVLKKSKKDE